MKINAKMLLYILSTSMLIFISSIGYITWESRQLALTEAHEIANKNAHEYANIIKSELRSYYNITRTLAQAGQAYHTLPWDEWNKIFLEQQLNIINENPHFLAVATSWELNHIDPNWDKPFGRNLSGWGKDRSGNINKIELRLNTEGDDIVKGIADHVIEIPDTVEAFTPLLTTIPMQLLSYHIAVMLDRNVDQPRNLAKSVTVE